MTAPNPKGIVKQTKASRKSRAKKALQPKSASDSAQDRAAHRHLRRSHPFMAELIDRARRFEVNAGGTIRPFEALAESIAYQQLSGKAAATIWGRVRALYGRSFDPKKVMETP